MTIARLIVASDAIGERVIAWGGRFKVDPITALEDGELTDARVAEYTDAKVAGYVARRRTARVTGGVARGRLYTFVRLDSQRSAFDRVGDVLRGDGNGPYDDAVRAVSGSRLIDFQD